MKFLEDPNPSITDLAQWISLDHILAARILKLANSPSYGVCGQISTLNLAIITIGLQPLKKLISSITTIDQFSDAAATWREQDNIFWMHSTCVGEGARRLSAIVGYPTSGEAFVAGLLHDLGHQVLAQLYPEYFTMISRHCHQNSIPRYQAERELLGYDHGQIGSWLARSWNFPESIIAVIEHHHTPHSVVENVKLVQLVHLANLIWHSMNQNSEINSQEYSDPEEEILAKFKAYFSINSRRLKDYQNFFKIDSQNSKLLTPLDNVV
jgi:HD-like signal output (HDOD) protein